MIDFGERKRFICLGDLIPTPLHIMPTLNPVWTRDPEKATNIKAEFLDLAADEGFNLIFRYTLPGEPVIYSVCKDGDGPHHGWQLNKPLWNMGGLFFKKAKTAQEERLEQKSFRLFQNTV